MKPVRHLVVMVKAPRVGAVKSRLAKGIGVLAAWLFYRRTTTLLLGRLQSPKWRLHLAVTPDGFVHRSRFWPRSLERIAQGPGDLGRRMAAPAMNFSPGPVVVVGSDVPGIEARHIDAAFKALETAHAVVGPAADGGYWLIGLRRRPAPPTRLRPGLYAGVRWSGPHALPDTLAGLDPRYKVARLETLSDVDNAEDYFSSKRSISSTKLQGLKR